MTILLPNPRRLLTDMETPSNIGFPVLPHPRRLLADRGTPSHESDKLRLPHPPKQPAQPDSTHNAGISSSSGSRGMVGLAGAALSKLAGFRSAGPVAEGRVGEGAELEGYHQGDHISGWAGAASSSKSSRGSTSNVVRWAKEAWARVTKNWAYSGRGYHGSGSSSNSSSSSSGTSGSSGCSGRSPQKKARGLWPYEPHLLRLQPHAPPAGAEQPQQSCRAATGQQRHPRPPQPLSSVAALPAAAAAAAAAAAGEQCSDALTPTLQPYLGADDTAVPCKHAAVSAATAAHPPHTAWHPSDLKDPPQQHLMQAHLPVQHCPEPQIRATLHSPASPLLSPAQSSTPAPRPPHFPPQCCSPPPSHSSPPANYSPTHLRPCFRGPKQRADSDSLAADGYSGTHTQDLLPQQSCATAPMVSSLASCAAGVQCFPWRPSAAGARCLHWRPVWQVHSCICAKRPVCMRVMHALTACPHRMPSPHAHAFGDACPHHMPSPHAHAFGDACPHHMPSPHAHAFGDACPHRMPSPHAHHFHAPCASAVAMA